MTHDRDHIVIHSVAQTVAFSSEQPAGRLKVWHCGLAPLLVGLLIGFILG